MSEHGIEAGEPDDLSWLEDPRAPDEHLEVLGRPEFVVPVIGSGISVPAGYPSSEALVETLVQIGRTAGLEDEELALPDPRSLADLLVGRGAIKRDELLRRVAAGYAVDPSGRSTTIDGLLQVRSGRVVTLNYDLSLEKRAEEIGVECESLILERDAAQVLEVLGAEASRDKLVIVHAHGVATEPETVVLDGDGYSALLAAPNVEACLLLLLLNHRLLFMGTRLDELHILSALIKLRMLKKRHLLVASQASADELHTASRSPLVPSTYLVLIRGYPNASGDHGELVPLVELLGRPPEEAEAAVFEGPLFPTVGAVPPPTYVETLMVEKREPEDDDFRASYLVALGLRSPITLEQVAAVGARTLIEGLPGAGKSTLLLEVGSRQPRAVVSLLLQASQLDLVGDPSLLLGRWLDGAEAFREGESRDPTRLEKDVFHFLIDGLDEVSFAQQAQAAKRIVEVAAANPTHSFTVASRAVPALEEFARPEWTRVVLAQSGDWRQAYLAKRDVEWQQLVEAAPLLHDLRGLLDLPFFLSQTVDLYERGELSEAGDMLSLVSRFVDAGLGAVEQTLPASNVRPWLRSLAVAMALAGRIDISLDEIAATLPDELTAFGDASAVAERLVTATLLRATAPGRYAFVHRIFGEALAAEALLEVDPEESGILDVAVPVATELIRGVRNDWLVPITLVAATSERWRTALAARDPLAAARAVSTNAPLEERHEAAGLIWDLYAVWRIWISDYRRMTIVEDEAVLARLLATEGLEELHAEIRNAVSSEVRETAGNAIRVLATLGDRAIESQLRHILETSDDYVLRRVAALAARDLKLDSLFLLIAHRAIHPAESTEAQDMTYAALDLARPEDLASLALRAARRGGEAIGILGHAIQSRLTAREELQVLRAWATRRAEPLRAERERVLALLPFLPLDDEVVVESALFVAGSWRIEDDDLKRLARDHPDATAKTVVELERLRVAHIFEVGWLLAEIDHERLVAVGASEEMIRYKETLDEWQRRRAE